MSKNTEPTNKHIHKLKRHKYANGENIYFCQTARCPFRCEVHLALGKLSLCHRCGKPFEMNEASIRLDRPHCDGCTVKRIKVDTPSNSNLNLNKRSEVESDVNDLRERLQLSIKRVLKANITETPNDESEDEPTML